MSLLNNALREAEERQRRPEITGAYTGAVQEGRNSSRWVVVLIFVLAIALASAGIYWFAMVGDSSSSGQAEDGSLASVENGRVERPQPDPEPRQTVTAAPEEAEEPVATETLHQKPPAPEKQAPERQADEQVASEPEPQAKPKPQPEPQTAVSQQPAVRAQNTEPAPEQPAVVKTVPQSPEAVDRKTAKELEKLIAGGDMVEAEQRLARLTDSQPALRSRFVVARALLVNGDASRALDWLPERLTADDPMLRMLRARAQHAGGDLDAAVATLESDVPGAAEQPEYRVTLATLLQQQGQGEKAAGHWAELIAWDDSRAPWWVGLAIALEDQGEIRGATRAYEQAVALPGLPPSLSDYVQRRLQSLRAG